MDSGWIGRRVFGEVERVDDDSVATQFFCVILPIWPERSVYVHRERGEWTVAPIPLHARSIALGYLRVTTWIAAWMVTAAVVVAWREWGALWPIATGLTALAAVLQFASGRLDPGERERRRLLRRVVGISAPPEYLPPARVESMRTALEARWLTDHAASWFEAIARGEASELLAALADYSGRPDLAHEVRERVAERHIN